MKRIRLTGERHSPRARARSGAALYVSVLAVSLLVAVLGLAAIQIADVQRRTAKNLRDEVAARENARSAVELALQDILSDSSWRTRYTQDVETTQLAMATGTASWRLKDATDPSLSDDPSDPVQVIGIGRAGNAAFVHTVTVQPVEVEVGPIDLRAYTDLSNVNTDVVTSSKAWAQYFRPYLPANASSWRVTGADIYVQQEGTVSGSTTVGLSLPQSDGKPGSTLIDQASVAESALPTSLQFVHVTFPSTTSLDPGTGLCLTLTTPTASVTPMRFGYDSSGLDATNTEMVTGSPAWQNIYTSKSLIFRVQGMYRVRQLQVVSGSWKRSPLP